MKIKIYFIMGYQVKDIYNDNLDVNIIFPNEDVYFSNLFTLQNVESLMKKFGNKYFCIEDLIIVKDLSIETIKEIIKAIIEEGLTDIYFSKIGTMKSIFGENPKYHGEVVTIEIEEK